ncbi:hypothetical protein G6F70_006921 [Rhizopus microsporus]|uniref:Dolichyl-diphosphooligosaccharide-protein glycosyltransferase subunit OST5 n=3 Tax=Rhizopus microsporus TaxID=58291 RepID=A0A2G4T5W1_RHIZD|nr:uncharacterized protein RHIMIDRAFT_234009 [Rhizopus microsporus ATCC 52813]KAG1197084.1 hypothetical protein G6F70_006921 [Rhizopus microsporus]ORE02501.1 hypothetical protein BCV72DRAFT_48777 [Rhizopus microsporus var. microsporus]KAG1207200.1 hypothetical protein G6F69_008238 [Rhizopus microsporus]KAG1230365.1 hypothetical protein G6F67_006513 [Rhizopus microsporus]KAG1262084.1 hypothetical protein G6F68_006207 [Rhizopus microsporus]
MTAMDDWISGTPITAPIPRSLYFLAAYFSITIGLFAAGTFIIQEKKTPIIQQLQSAIIASVLLGFGAIFASNAAGVYL